MKKRKTKVSLQEICIIEFSSPSIAQLFQELSSNLEKARIYELRQNFLRGFLGQKLLDPLPKCPIECMFWDWVYSYYPDNEMSTVRYISCGLLKYRFSGFTKEYITFVISHKRFAQGYLDWIQQNEGSLISFAISTTSIHLTPFETKVYADIFKQILKEKLYYVTTKIIDYE